MKGLICFDMDGTIVDLYGVANWEKKLNREDTTPYCVARPMWDMEALNSVLQEFINDDWEIRVISWLSKTGSPEYHDAVRRCKLNWLRQYDFPVKKCHFVAYGTTKADCIRHIKKPAILIDDNRKVRQGWTLGRTIDPEKTDIINELWAILNDE